jgi:hypothetical protein
MPMKNAPRTALSIDRVQRGRDTIAVNSSLFNINGVSVTLYNLMAYCREEGINFDKAVQFAKSYKPSV